MIIGWMGYVAIGFLLGYAATEESPLTKEQLNKDQIALCKEGMIEILKEIEACQEKETD